MSGPVYFMKWIGHFLWSYDRQPMTILFLSFPLGLWWVESKPKAPGFQFGVVYLDWLPIKPWKRQRQREKVQSDFYFLLLREGGMDSCLLMLSERKRAWSKFKLGTLILFSASATVDKMFAFLAFFWCLEINLYLYISILNFPLYFFPHSLKEKCNCYVLSSLICDFCISLEC